MTYGFLLESIWHPPLCFAETGGSALPPELELQSLWFSGAFGRQFKTTLGKPVVITQFGEWNRCPGPDFIHAAAEIDGIPLAGPIELDPDAAAWEQHGHAANPDFRDVIVHVIFREGPRTRFTRTLENRDVPQIVITESQLADALNRPPREVAIAHPGRCLHPLKHLSASSLEKLLNEAAAHRAKLKAARFLRTADAHGRDAALFQATAETLGYSANPLPMRLLAQRTPLQLLRTDPTAAEAVLFGTAGFLSPELHESAPDDTREYLRQLWETWWKNRGRLDATGCRDIPWKTHGQRPANHPHRRIGALAALVKAWPQYRKIALARPFNPKALVDFLTALRHPFWSQHHSLTSLQAATPIAIFGRAHALELLANHLIPLALHEDGFTFRSYQKIRHSATNDKVKRCSLRLFGSLKAAQPWTRRLAYHQALLQVYHDFCLEDLSACNDCPFPEQLLQWK